MERSVGIGSVFVRGDTLENASHLDLELSSTYLLIGAQASARQGEDGVRR
jgi:hypothetical protein